MSNKLRVIFAGTPDFAAQSLQALLDSHHEVIAVYTQPDRRSGRGKKITASAVKQLAQAHDIPVVQPVNFKSSEHLAELAAFNADIMVVVAYGIILPISVLQTPALGCINVHASLLPRWRGAAPIERSLLEGDHETGITIMQMDEGLDTGDMLYKAAVPITDEMTSGDLYLSLIPVAKQALVETLNLISDGKHQPEPQNNDLACYANKLFKAEGNIDWQLSATDIALIIRGLSPRPVAFSHYNENAIRIWSAEVVQSNPESENSKAGVITKVGKQGIEVNCANNTKLLITSLQIPGGKQLSVQQLLNAKPDLFSVGSSFYSELEK